MENEDLKQFEEFLSGYSIEISNPRLKKSFKGIYEILEFIKIELHFWELTVKNQAIENDFRNTLVSFRSCNSSLLEIIGFKDSVRKFDQAKSDANQKLNGVKSFLNKSNIYFSEWPESKLLKSLAETHLDEVDGASWYFVANSDKGQLNQNHLKGFLKAYEYDLNGGSDITKRSQEELKSLEKIKIEWNQALQDAKKDYLEVQQEILNKSTDFEEKHELILRNGNNEIENIKNNFKNSADVLIEGVNTWQKNIDNQFDSFKESKSKEADALLVEKKQNLDNLEYTYNDKLQLATPIEYWNERIKKYRKNGWRWFTAFSGLIVGVLSYFIYFITHLNNTFLLVSGKYQFDPNSIRGIVTFLTVVSFSAYLIRVFSKLTFSSFHLQRDSEERMQLTRVYLALLKDGNHKAGEKDKEIILQALFGRVETGLLNIDGAPTIPGVNYLIDKVTNK